MLWKLAFLFLIGMAVMLMFKARPRRGRRRGDAPKVRDARLCPKCGAYTLADQKCPECNGP